MKLCKQSEQSLHTFISDPLIKRVALKKEPCINMTPSKKDDNPNNII